MPRGMPCKSAEFLFIQSIAHNMIRSLYNSAKLLEVNPVGACRGVPMELTPRASLHVSVVFWESVSLLLQA